MSLPDGHDSLLAISLAAAVPLRIMVLQRQGGPTEMDWRNAVEFGSVLAEKGDILQFGYGKRQPREGEPSVADLFNQLARAVAVLAFVPGGVRLFGMHFTVGDQQ